jgi:small-conductance mechanosensitive channel
MKSATVGVVLLAVAFFIVVFLAVSFLVMLLANVVLGHYDVKLLDYGTALAVTALSTLLFGGSRVGNSSSK